MENSFTAATKRLVDNKVKGMLKSLSNPTPTFKIGDIIKSKPQFGKERKYEVISKNYKEYTIKCVATPVSSELGQIDKVEINQLEANCELVESSNLKPVDQAYNDIHANMSTKRNPKGEMISTEIWNKLYCSCDNRQPKPVTVLKVTHSICTNCKKEIIN